MTEKQPDNCLYIEEQIPWILDSGSSRHVCCSKNSFIAIKETPITLNWGNASKLKASGIGTVKITFSSTNNVATLNNVLFCYGRTWGPGSGAWHSLPSCKQGKQCGLLMVLMSERDEQGTDCSWCS